MPNDLSNPMSSAGGTIELGGKTYLLTQTRGADIEDFLSWLRDELRKLPSPIDLVKPSLAGLSESLQARLIERAYEDLQRQQELDAPEARAIQASLSGTAFLLWLHLRAKHPELRTYEDVKQLLASEAVDLERIQARLDELQHLSAGGPAANPPEGPAATRDRPTGPGSVAISRPAMAGRWRKSRRSR